MDRVFAVHAGSRGFDSHRRHMSERFFLSNRPGYPQPACSELEIALGFRVAVGDWLSVISVSLNVGGGVRLIKTGKTVHVHANTLQTRVARPWFRTAEPLGKRRFEDWITHTQTHTQVDTATVRAVISG